MSAQREGFLAAPPDQWMNTEAAMGIGQKARPGIIGRAPPACVYERQNLSLSDIRHISIHRYIREVRVYVCVPLTTAGKRKSVG